MAQTLPVAVDAMGGDHAPAAIVSGAVQAARTLGVPVTLVGRRDAVEHELRTLGAATNADGVSIVDAADVIAMDEHPANAVRGKPESSIARACALVAGGTACAAVSAGNSGAMLAAALFTVKRIAGIARPAIGASFPNASGQTFLLDVGANTDCKPEWLAQFAVMGDVYSRTMLGVAEPRVALLSNGEEAEKGSELVRASRPLIEKLPLHFIGNVESKDVFRGVCDVAVTDGFSGNLVLKTAEGVAEFLFATISSEARASISGKLGGALLKPKLRPLRDRVDYRKTGGALLLGVAGEVVIAHGRSDAEAIVNAIRVAHDAASRDISGTIAGAISNAPVGESATIQAAAGTSPSTPEERAGRERVSR